MVAAESEEGAAAASSSASLVAAAKEDAAAARAEAAASRAEAATSRAELERATHELERTTKELASSQVATRCALDALGEEEGAAASARRAVGLAHEERDSVRSQAQRAIDAASQQLESATREAAKQVADAEQRASAAVAAADGAGGGGLTSEQEEMLRGRVSTLEGERDEALASLSKAKAELGTLRTQVLEAEESSSSREEELASKVRELQGRLAKLHDEQQQQQQQQQPPGQEAAEARASAAERALSDAQRRCAEQETALNNLQGVLESMHLQSSSGGAAAADEAAQLRVGGISLVAELRALEATMPEWHGARRAGEELSAARATLAAAEGERGRLQEEVGNLHALLRAANSAHAADTSIDKRLVASVLVKCFEPSGRNQGDMLAVLASMLGCTPDEQRLLGVLPGGRASSVPEIEPNAKLSDMWADFLLGEADRDAGRT